MKLTKSILTQMIQEVLWDAMPTKRTNGDYKRQRREDIFAGINSLRSLSRGIVEEQDEDENDGRVCIDKGAFDTLMSKLEDYLNLIEEDCADDKKGNRRHTISGEFGSKSNNTSWSLQDQGCGANQMKPNSNQRRWTKIPCGRSARRIGKNVRCRDGKELPL